jgi:cytochrome c
MFTTRSSIRCAMLASLIGFAFAPAAYAQNPCATASGKVDASLVTRPAGTHLADGKHAELAAFGKQLFSDTKLSGNGMSCASCHTGNASFAKTFAQPYPHFVKMAADRGGFKKIALDEMVQFCMIVPMAAKPLAWNSRELAALTAYTADIQKTFKPVAAARVNPCAAKNPCAMK